LIDYYPLKPRSNGPKSTSTIFCSNAFLETHPYQSVGEDDPQSGDRIVKFRLISESPPELAIVLGDAIHNLRSALDHLACQIVLAGGGKPNTHTAFPIFYAQKTFEAKFNGKIHGASQKMLDLVRGLNPYRRGNELLWALHKLDIIDKHRLLIPVATRSPLVFTNTGVTPIQGFPVNKHGQILYWLKAADRPQMYEDPYFGFDIGFGDVLKGYPIVNNLVRMLNLTRSYIVDIFGPLL
jgi:hypothetical protein